jgi:hypothetical protein
MAKKKPEKKTPKKRGTVNFRCDNPGRAFNLKTLRNMLEDHSSGFATFFFPVLKDAMMNSNEDAIKCVDSYLAPEPDELKELGIPAAQIEGYRRCTDSSLLVAVIAQQNA